MSPAKPLASALQPPALRWAHGVLWLYLLSPVILYPALGTGRGWADVLFLFNVLTSLLWAGLLAALGVRPLVLHLLLAPLYLTTAVDLFLLTQFGARLSSGYISIAISDHADTAEFLRSYAKPVALMAGTLAVIYLPCLYLLRQLPARTRPRLAVASAAALLVLYAGYTGRSVWLDVAPKRAVLDLAGKEMSAPVGAAFQGALAWSIHVESSRWRELRAGHRFDARRVGTAAGEVHVLVIGESARPDHWSLFGYSRDTTPKLKALQGLVGFPDMLTTAPHTAIAVPSMLSLRPITEWDAVQSEKSIVGAFAEAGFRTHWISTQEADSWGGLVPQLAGEARHRRYFDRARDGDMLAEVRSVLDTRASGEAMLLVLHSKGSHFEFKRRYPEEFERFTGGRSRREQLVDTYDNTILYTDWFLHEVIAALQRRAVPAVLWYASDHGENLLDDERQLFGHALGTRQDLQTAAFVWVSPEMAAIRPSVLQHIRQHSRLPLSLGELPHAVLDLAGIDAKGLDAKRSFARATFSAGTRHYMVRGELKSEDQLPRGAATATP